MKDTQLYFAIIGVCGAVFLPLHALAIRLLGSTRLLTALTASVLISGAAGAMLCSWWFGGDFSSEQAQVLACVAGALTFLGFAGVYCLLLPISVDRSVSAHIVSLIWLAPEHRLKERELFQLYTHDDILRKRFEECIETGIIVRHDGELTLTSHGARIAFIFVTLGRLLGIRLWHIARRDAHVFRDPA